MARKRADKQALRGELAAIVRKQRDELIAAHKTSAEGVTHADSRAEGDKDMRATEASYIARGQARRAEALAADLDRIMAMTLRDFGADDPIAMSAVVTVDDEESGLRRVFVAPAGGGARIGGDIQVTTPGSPLGRALLGARREDVVELTRAGEPAEMEIVDVQ